MKVIGQVITGEHGKILIRQKSDEIIELGELLVVDDENNNNCYTIFQVFDLLYGSQIPKETLELMSGLSLEGFGNSSDFMEKELRSYVLAIMKALIRIENNKPKIPKTLPNFFSNIRRITAKDLEFLEKPGNPVFLGYIRSGSRVLNDVEINLDAKEMFTHHVFIPATTGRGKSNLIKTMLWRLLDNNYCGILVLDPHDEYFGRIDKGLNLHSNSKDNLKYYTPTGVRGCITLRINIKTLRPWHFNSILPFTEAQERAVYLFYRRHRENWLSELIKSGLAKHQVTKLEEDEREEKDTGLAARTITILQRKFEVSLGLYFEKNEVLSKNNVFVTSGGDSTICDICDDLENGKVVIVDTSQLDDEAELLIGNVIASEILERYKTYKAHGKLDQKPPISIIIEEAPRVLSTEIIEAGGNIYSTIAKEGRKFKIGLVAITQLVSIIPRNILANMNTKIILGNEMGPERRAILDSSSQDLSGDDKTIAGLDKGEAIISSVFTKFAVPIKIPLFDNIVKEITGTTQKIPRSEIIG